jgi:hypothetical protein
MMRHWHSWCSAGVFLAAMLVVSIGQSDDKEKSGGKPAAKVSKESAAKSADKGTAGAKEGKRRLPRYYGRLGLSEAQREKIYDVQSKYESDIDKVEKQLADLKSRQEADCRKVLNADQKKQLADAVEAAKAKNKLAKSDGEEMEE